MIKTENLTKQYTKTLAVDRLSLHIPEGEVFGFLGPNGAGKTTTLRILGGLARPTSGTTEVAGVNPAMDGRRLSSVIGFLPEEPSFYPWMTPPEFLDYLGRLHGLPTPQRTARIKELLKLGIPKDQILMTLERRMKCGIGKCGHCAIDYIYTCLDGPVFTYWDVLHMRELI